MLLSVIEVFNILLGTTQGGARDLKSSEEPSHLALGTPQVALLTGCIYLDTSDLSCFRQAQNTL